MTQRSEDAADKYDGLLLVGIEFYEEDIEPQLGEHQEARSPWHQDWCLGSDGTFQIMGRVYGDTLLVPVEYWEDCKEWLAEYEFGWGEPVEVKDDGTVSDGVGIATGFRKLPNGGWQVLQDGEPGIDDLEPV